MPTAALPLAAVVVSALCYGTLAVLAAVAYRLGAEPLQLLAWRFTFAALLLAGYQLARGRSLKVGIADLTRLAAVALLGYGAASVSFFFAVRHVDASVAAVLLYTYPAIVALASRLFLGERMGPLGVVAVAVTTAGCALTVGAFDADVGFTPLGVAFGLGAGVGFASFTMLSAGWLKTGGRGVLMTYVFAFSAGLAAALALVGGSELLPGSWSIELWALLALIVLVPTFLAVVLFLQGVRSLGPARASLVSAIEPVFTALLAVAVLGERLSGLQLLGAGFVVSGVVLAEWRAARRAASKV